MAEELPSSQLGTKEYWDEFYSNELSNYEDHEEEGEVWFGMESVRRMVSWLTKNVTDRGCSILDLGCGNGMVLLELESEGFTNLSGVDYSESAVQLATSLAQGKHITYQGGDLLNLQSSGILQRRYKILLDKGTYDAISLSPQEAKSKRSTYILNTHKLLEPSGALWITSCNWTTKELVEHFTSGGLFSLREEIPVRQFQFGGSTGQTVCCAVFTAHKTG